MSSDYISRLRGELLRAGAAHEGRSREHAGAAGDARRGAAGTAGDARRGGAGAASDARRGAAGDVRPPQTRRRRRRPSTRTVRRLRPLAGALAIALVIAAVVFTLPRDRADDVAVPPTTQRLDHRTSPAATEATVRILQERLDRAEIRGARTITEGGEIKVAAPPDATADVTALMEPGRFSVYYFEGSVLGPDGKTAPGDPDVTGGDNAGRAASVTKAEAEKRAEGHPDARVVRAESGDGYFALEGPPALTNSGLESAQLAYDVPTQEPIVAVEFTEEGQRAFADVTREVAQGGANYAMGAEAPAGNHHFAIVVDDRIVSVPYIDWRENPDGIDGASGAQINVATADQARLLAAILSTPPLP